MDYEKKYKDAQKWVESIYSELSHEHQMEAEAFFPELKESEDERIRKAILELVRQSSEVLDRQNQNNMIAWLEKQGEPTDINPSEFDLRLNRLLKQFETLPKEELASSLSFYLNVIQNDGAYKPDGKQGEQKPADKVEPKFKVGDWVVDEEDNYVYQVIRVISNVSNGLFSYDLTDSGYFYSTKTNCHLWTIKDAKDGDVLASNRSIFIFSQEYIAGKPEAHCGIMNGLFIAKSEGCWTNEECYPATKSQRDTLFAKMKEAGYEWDAEKKELKKSADKQKFKVGDYVVISTTKGDKVVQIASVEYLKGGYPSYITTEGRWFGNGTKARILTDKDMETITIPGRSTIVKKIKSWSEEDVFKVQRICKYLDEAKKYYADVTEVRDCIDWLKSIKDRVQPKHEWSEEDEQYLLVCKNALEKYQTTDKWDANIIFRWLKNKLKK